MVISKFKKEKRGIDSALKRKSNNRKKFLIYKYEKMEGESEIEEYKKQPLQRSEIIRRC